MGTFFKESLILDNTIMDICGTCVSLVNNMHLIQSLDN